MVSNIKACVTAIKNFQFLFNLPGVLELSQVPKTALLRTVEVALVLQGPS